MKFKITLSLLLFAFLSQAQVTNEGKPKSWKLRNTEAVAPITMPEFDLAALEAEDKVNDARKDIPWRFGYEFMVDYNLNNSGNWHTMPDGSRVWRIRFYSEGAKTMNFLFSDFYMPKGAMVYLYNNDRSDLLGAYDESQNNDERVLGTWMVNGEDIWIEYYEPAEVAGQGKLEIFKVVHGYRSADSFTKSTNGLNDSGNCNYDVDCAMPGIEDLKEINKKAVALLLVGNSSFCSGALINNTSNNGTPYLLTANHCYSNPSQWAFRFNWISPNPVCASTASSPTNNDFHQTASGAILRARRAASDFCLVEITANLPNSWDLIWAGWDRTDNTPSSTFGIHHPSGDIMKACRDFNSPSVLNSGGEYMWQINDWDVGVTEGGSSGSPLFDNNGRIIGQLYAGTAACNGTNDNGGQDIYGRFAISWNQGVISTQRLKEWLDPGNTNATTLDYYPLAATYATDAQLTLLNLGNDACGNTIAPVIRITNSGTNQLNSVQINYQLNGGATQTISWSGFLNTGQSSNVSLPQLTGVNGENTFTVTLTQPNSLQDENTENNTVTETFAVNVYAVGDVTFNLNTDNYGSETAWEVTNQNGTVLYSGGNYASNQSYSQLLALGEGCYTFTITDSFGDGICCSNGNGNYSLTAVNGATIIEGGNFEESESVTFSLDPSVGATQKVFGNALKIYPNPSSGVFTIAVTEALQADYQLYNMLGQPVAAGHFTTGESKLDISAAADGIYILQVTDNSGRSANFKLVKE